MINQVECAKTNPTISVLAKMAAAMEIGLAELIEPRLKPLLYRRTVLTYAPNRTFSRGSIVCIQFVNAWRFGKEL